MKIITAQRRHKKRVIQLITDAFSEDPQILNYCNGKINRIKLIAALAFETSIINNMVFLTEDLNAMAICYSATQHLLNARVLFTNLKFPFVFGLRPLLRMLKTENQIHKKRDSSTKGLYLWLLAASPESKGQGLGGFLLQHIFDLKGYNKLILETSNKANISFYEKRGFVKSDLLTPPS
ncbi:MAG: GNAT family N-acetyltransferase [Pseudarcicella sp.]|nr:GNAT family N-acetyltransferase [Pseudarcicella sp.]